MNKINQITAYGVVYDVEDARVDEQIQRANDIEADIVDLQLAVEELKAGNTDEPATHTISIKGRYLSNPGEEGSDPYYNDFDFSFKVNADTSKPFTIEDIPNGTYAATGTATVEDGGYYDGKASEVEVKDTYFIIKVIESMQGECDCNCSRAELAPYFTDTVGAAEEESATYDHTIKVTEGYDPDDSGAYWNECDFQFIVTNDSSEAFESLIDIPEGEYPASGTFYNASMSTTYSVSKVNIYHSWESDEHEISIHFTYGGEEWTQLYRLPYYEETVTKREAGLYKYSIRMQWDRYTEDGYEDRGDIKTCIYLNEKKAVLTASDFPMYCPAFGYIYIGDSSQEGYVTGLRCGTDFNATMIVNDGSGGTSLSEQWVNEPIIIESVEKV